MRTRFFYCQSVMMICPFSYEVFSVIYVFSSSFCMSVNYNSLFGVVISWNFTNDFKNYMSTLPSSSYQCQIWKINSSSLHQLSVPEDS